LNLNGMRRPAAIFFAVVPVVVDAVYRCVLLTPTRHMSVVSCAHVFLEEHEVIPSRTNGDASRSVVAVRADVAVEAPASHRLPYAIQAGVMLAVSEAAIH
jgi:hypothetical protein